MLYSGELKPREPVDADENSKGAIHVFDLAQSSAASDSKWSTVNATSPKASVPIPRVGAASAIIDDRLYVWGGRGGTQMAPLGVEAAGVYRCAVTDNALSGKVVWEKVPAMNESEAPDPRSYHAMVSHAVRIYASTPLTSALIILVCRVNSTSMQDALNLDGLETCTRSMS